MMLIKGMNSEIVTFDHGLRMLKEEIAFTTQPKIHYHSKMFRYS